MRGKERSDKERRGRIGGGKRGSEIYIAGSNIEKAHDAMQIYPS